MFTRWGDLVYRLRWAVIGFVVAGMLGLGAYGLGIEDRLSASGWFDPGSESAQAARLSDEAFGRDHNADVLVLYTAPEGQTIDSDPAFRDKIVDSLNSLPREHPEQIARVNGAYWATETGDASPAVFGSKDKTKTFASVAIVGDNDTDMLKNYRAVKDVFDVDGVDVQVAGLQPVAGTLNDTMAHDQKRMEMLAIPAVGLLLFFIFGGVVAAGLPLIVGGLTIISANGIIMMLTYFTEVNSFVGAVVSMIGLGLAIDYGLFIVSRFREELAEGYDTPAAVRRSVSTAGRTVVFSATMIIASLGGLLLFPQGFLKSVAYGTIATVALAAIGSITLLPAMLSVLGRRVDMLSFKKMRRTKSAEEVEASFWGRATTWVMQHPLKIAIPISVLLLLLIIPVKNLAFGGMSETYLPPDNDTRVAQEEFDQTFPLRQSDPIQLVFVGEDTSSIAKVLREADEAPGLADAAGFAVPSKSQTHDTVYRTSATLADSEEYEPTIDHLRAIDVPDDVTMLVGGQPTLQMDSVDSLLDRMPLMIALVLFVTTVLMFLTFGSLVLPIKAALMSALGLGSTLGILTWIFIDGHGSGLLNFTPQPIMSPVLVLIIAIIYGLSTDYEVFLLSRMVEARAQGASTTEAVRIGTAHTGRIITAAALILLVVTGAFAFSDLVLMQYIAYGMIAALIIDATILRMLLVPATMKLLGDDCWWAPAWMKRVQEKIGLGEPILADERPGSGDVVDLVKTTPVTDPVTMQMPALADEKQRQTPVLKRTREEIDAAAPTAHMQTVSKKKKKAGGRRKGGDTPPTGAEPDAPEQAPMPAPPDPDRPRTNPPGGSADEPGPGAGGSRPGIPDRPTGGSSPDSHRTPPPGPRPPADGPRQPPAGPGRDPQGSAGPARPGPIPGRPPAPPRRPVDPSAEAGRADAPRPMPPARRPAGPEVGPGRPPGGGNSADSPPGGGNSAGRPPGGGNSAGRPPGPDNGPGNPPGGGNAPARAPGPDNGPGRPPGGGNIPGRPSGGSNGPGRPPGGGNTPGRPSGPGIPPGGGNIPGRPPGGSNGPGRPPGDGNAPGPPPGAGTNQAGPDRPTSDRSGARTGFATPTLRGLFASEPTEDEGRQVAGRTVYPTPADAPPLPPTPQQARGTGGSGPSRPQPQQQPDSSLRLPGASTPGTQAGPEARPPAPGPRPGTESGRPPAPPRRPAPSSGPPREQPPAPSGPPPPASGPGNGLPGATRSGPPELPRRTPGGRPPAVPGPYRGQELPPQPPSGGGPRPDSLAEQSAQSAGGQNPDPRERNSIESWMAGLRSARREQTDTPPAVDDPGRHQHGENRSVSVNELLRRREDQE